MINNNKLHISLDEARIELSRRWRDDKLKKKIEDILGELFIPNFRMKPRAVSFRQICSPDNGFAFFFQCAKYVGAEPLVIEFHDDIFVHFNEEKKGLGRLRLTLNDGSRAMVDIMDFHDNEKKKLGDIKIKTGELLVNFHHNLFKVFGYDINLYDNSSWFVKLGHASNYYYYFLLHFIAHGFLSENLYEGDESQISFGDKIMIPVIEKIRDEFGLNPLIIRSFPDNQNDIEDFYWWSYPPNVNEYIIKYVNDNKLMFKKINF